MRTLLRLATVLTVFLGVAFVQLPVSQAIELPETLADRRPVGVGVVTPPFSIDYLGVLWDTRGTSSELGRGAGVGHGSVRFRSDGQWTAWQPLTDDGAQAEGQWASALVPAGDAEAYQVRGVPVDALAPRAVALNTTDGPPRVVGRVPAGGANAVPSCLSRAEWGADETLRFDDTGKEIWPAEFFPAQTMTVHHTATANNDPTPAATVRAIYRYHAVDRAWGDIGYNYLLDEQGRVYEGRWSGAPSAPCGGTGGGSDFAQDDGNGLVTGAHTGGYNSGNMGAALLGTFTTAADPQPSAVAVDALENLLAEFATRNGLDPKATVSYINPVNGFTKTVDMISGHRDWVSTECPGANLYGQLPAIRDAVAAQSGSGTAPASGGGAVPTVLERTVAVGADDAEERANGVVKLGDGDLELAQDGSNRQTVGLRFTGVTIPVGAKITGAYVQFTADEVKTGAASLAVTGQAADDAGAFTTSSKNISSRPRTTSVAWNPAAWPKAGARTAEQRTPDLSTVLQEIVSRDGWASGNDLALIVTGTGTRTAESFEGGAQKAAVLHIEYTQ